MKKRIDFLKGCSCSLPFPFLILSGIAQSEALAVVPIHGIFPHRSAVQTHSENMLVTLKEAIHLAIHVFKLDMRLSKHNELIVMHD